MTALTQQDLLILGFAMASLVWSAGGSLFVLWADRRSERKAMDRLNEQGKHLFGRRGS